MIYTIDGNYYAICLDCTRAAVDALDAKKGEPGADQIVHVWYSNGAELGQETIREEA